MTQIYGSSRHCYSLHVGFPSATHPQEEQRIFVATPPLAAIQYLQREREGRQESPWGHCPVRGQTNTDQVPWKLSAISTPNLRTKTQAPHTQRQNLKTQEQEERDPKAIWPLCLWNRTDGPQLLQAKSFPPPCKQSPWGISNLLTLSQLASSPMWLSVPVTAGFFYAHHWNLKAQQCQMVT